MVLATVVVPQPQVDADIAPIPPLPIAEIAAHRYRIQAYDHLINGVWRKRAIRYTRLAAALWPAKTILPKVAMGMPARVVLDAYSIIL